MFYRIIELKKSWMIKAFLKSSSVEIDYEKGESPPVETVGVKYEKEVEEKEKEVHKNFVFIRKTPVYPRERLSRKTTKKIKYY